MQKLGHISLIAKDIEKLKKFYQELFGFVLEFETEDKLYVQYSVNDTDNKFDLEHISLLQTDLPNSAYQGFLLRFETDDLDKIAKQCFKYGGRIIREPIKQDYGSIEMYLEDPEGNLIQIYQLLN
ncbi:MAG: VOC family protein [Patescibacteria group bacterium]